MTTRDIIIIGIFTAIICIFSVISIPIGLVPITLSIFSIILTSVILGFKKSFFSTLIYILCGSLGLPVFSGFQGGFNMLSSPTGGYIIGYIFIPLIVGFCSDILKHKRMFFLILSAILSMIFCYILGTLQFSFITNSSFKSSLILCVYPFLLFDGIKIISAITLGEIIKKRLKFIDI